MNSGDSETILRHVATFGVTTEAVVARRWGARGAELLADLVASKQLAIGGNRRDGERLYQLDQKAARPDILRERYLVLAFCALGSTQRRPITTARIEEDYPDFSSRAFHCHEAGPPPRIWRVYTPKSVTADIQAARHLRQSHEHSQNGLPKKNSFRELVAEGHYGFAVLLDDEARAHKLRGLLAERPLPPAIAVTVECFA